MVIVQTVHFKLIVWCKETKITGQQFLSQFVHSKLEHVNHSRTPLGNTEHTKFNASIVSVDKSVQLDCALVYLTFTLKLDRRYDSSDFCSIMGIEEQTSSQAPSYASPSPKLSPTR